MNRSFNGNKISAQTFLLFCFLFILPVQGTVRTYLEGHYDYFRKAMEKSLCKIPINKLPDGTCRYQYLLDVKREDIKTLPDSMIISIKTLIESRFYKFPANLGHLYVNDTFCVAFNVFMFCDSTMPLDQRLQAFDLLVKKTSDKVLLPYRTEIITAMNWHRLSQDSKADMAALLNCNSNEQHLLFGENMEFSFKVKARLGNKVAVEKLISRFDSSKTYEDKMAAMKELFFSGNPTAIKHIIQKFGHPAFEANGDCGHTMQYQILCLLSYYHVGDAIFNQHLDVAYDRSRKFNDQNAVKGYYQKVYAWMFEKYQVRPFDLPPSLYFTKTCFE